MVQLNTLLIILSLTVILYLIFMVLGFSLRQKNIESQNLNKK